MSEITLKSAKEMAINFAEGCGIEKSNQVNFVQNAILLAQDDKTKDYDFKDVLKCLMKADKFGVSLVKGEASMYPVNCKVGNAYVKKPLLIIDYKFEWQQILTNGDCEKFNIVPVFEGDFIERSLIGHKWEPSGELECDAIGYYGYYKGHSGLEVGLYMSKAKILGKLPENNKNALYKGDDNQSEWLFKKMVLRQIRKQIPNSEKMENIDKAEGFEMQLSDNEVVNKSAAKLPVHNPEPEANQDKEDELY